MAAADAMTSVLTVHADAPFICDDDSRTRAAALVNADAALIVAAADKILLAEHDALLAAAITAAAVLTRVTLTTHDDELAEAADACSMRSADEVNADDALTVAEASL